MDKIYEEIFEYANNIEIIDTHEHLPSWEKDRDKNADVLKEYLSHYFNRDLISAGLPKEDYHKVIEEKIPIVQKWKLIEPYWELSKYTGYGRLLNIAVKDIYGIEKIDGSTIENLNDKFLDSLKIGHFKKILKDMCKISTSLLNVDTLDEKYNVLQFERSIYCDRDLYSPVYSISDFVYLYSWSQIEKVERQSCIRITSFSKWLEATEMMINKAYKLGAVALKNPLAYYRTLKYERVSRARAEKEFNNIFKTKNIPDWYERILESGKDFQDYMFHHILDIANTKNLILQIHTGIQEGNGNILSNSNPELLSNLFLQYPDVIFNIFHMGYPYQNVLGVLAKNYPNVYIDMCWSHIVSPNAAINSLIEWLELIPLNKISVFGGDRLFVDGVYGHLQITKENVAKALSFKISQGLFDVEEAKKITKLLFYDNPLKLYKLRVK